MKIVDGKFEAECLAEQEIIDNYRQAQFLHKLCECGKEIEQMTSDPNEQIKLKLMLLKSLQEK